MADNETRLRRLEGDMHKVIGIMRHGPRFLDHPHFAKGGMITFLEDRGGGFDDYPPYNRQIDNRSRDTMSKTPAITADTADELNDKLAAAEAEAKRNEAIRTLATVVKQADQMREQARAQVKKAKAARRALKSVRNNPDATIEEIEAALQEAGIRY